MKLKKQSNAQRDSKFSFVVIRKCRRLSLMSNESPEPWPTLVLPPLKRKQHVVVNVCSANGNYNLTKGKLEKSVVLKSHGEIYKTARKAKWGDLWPHKFQAAVSDFIKIPSDE